MLGSILARRAGACGFQTLWKGEALSAGFSKRLEKKTKERKYAIAVSDEKMIKLTTKEDSKEAAKMKVRRP